MSSSGSIVKLNIGGTVFQTAKSSLTRFDGFFKTLLETEIPVTKDESGAIFVDRNPKHFAMILDYMRDGDVDLPKCEQECQEILKEANFYLLEGLVELCEKSLKSRTVISLNIGGTVFQTTKSTLTKYDGIFKTFLETDVPVTKDDSGAIFIDRSAKHFDLILKFMREGYVKLPNSDEDHQELIKEARYYQLTSIIDACNTQKMMKDFDANYLAGFAKISLIDSDNQMIKIITNPRKPIVIINYRHWNWGKYFHSTTAIEFVEKHKDRFDVYFKPLAGGGEYFCWTFAIHYKKPSIYATATAVEDPKKFISCLENNMSRFLSEFCYT